MPACQKPFKLFLKLCIIFIVLFLCFLLEGSSGHGWLPSLQYMYNQLPFTSVTQFPTSVYQTSHTQSAQKHTFHFCENSVGCNFCTEFQEFNCDTCKRSPFSRSFEAFVYHIQFCCKIILECVNVFLSSHCSSHLTSIQ